VFAEADLVSGRLDAQAASQALLTQMAVSTIPNQSVKPTATKNMAALFTKQIKRLLGER